MEDDIERGMVREPVRTRTGSPEGGARLFMLPLSHKSRRRRLPSSKEEGGGAGAGGLRREGPD